MFTVKKKKKKKKGSTDQYRKEIRPNHEGAAVMNVS